jgi:hypothetical protein
VGPDVKNADRKSMAIGMEIVHIDGNFVVPAPQSGCPRGLWKEYSIWTEIPTAFYYTYQADEIEVVKTPSGGPVHQASPFQSAESNIALF